MHQHGEVGRRFGRGHAQIARDVRQARQRLVHAVLHELLRKVRIGAELEGDGQRQRAVRRRLRRHVEHALDAADLLLERRRHRVRDGVGIGAGEHRGHDDRGRHDLGIFRDRQLCERDQAGQEDDDRDHAGEDRPVDEEFGQVHGRFPRLLLYGYSPAGGGALSAPPPDGGHRPPRPAVRAAPRRR